jgi:hypothetical protein
MSICSSVQRARSRGWRSRGCPRNSFGLHSGYTFSGHQKIGAQAWIAAAPVADADIDVVALEVRQPRIGIDAHFDVGVGASEALEARQQPLARKGGRGADGKPNLGRRSAQLLDGCRQAVEAVAQALEAGLAGIGEQDLAVEAAEQRDAQPFLQRLHLMADRRRRHVQLGGRLADAQRRAAASRRGAR